MLKNEGAFRDEGEPDKFKLFVIMLLLAAAAAAVVVELIANERMGCSLLRRLFRAFVGESVGIVFTIMSSFTSPPFDDDLGATESFS